jgi:hypothetical protein
MGLAVTSRAFWLIAHLAVGAIIIHGFAEVVLSLRGAAAKLRPMAQIGSIITALVAWATVISGTWIVYPWYRANPPAGVDVANYPKAYLVEHPNLVNWHEFGMEWKEHVGWIAPIIATAVAFVILRYGRQLTAEPKIRRALMTLLVIGVFSSVVAGVVGVFLNKVAPNTFLNM